MKGEHKLLKKLTLSQVKGGAQIIVSCSAVPSSPIFYSKMNGDFSSPCDCWINEFKPTWFVGLEIWYIFMEFWGGRLSLLDPFGQQVRHAVNNLYIYIYIYINKKERETRGKKQQNILVQEEGRIFPLNKS